MGKVIAKNQIKKKLFKKNNEEWKECLKVKKYCKSIWNIGITQRQERKSEAILWKNKEKLQKYGWNRCKNLSEGKKSMRVWEYNKVWERSLFKIS